MRWPWLYALAALSAGALGVLAVLNPLLPSIIAGVTLTGIVAVKAGLRRSLLGLLILSLTLVRFSDLPGDINVGLLRYGAAIMLVGVTWHERRARHRRVRDTPLAAQRLMTGLWLLVLIAFVSITWSVSPFQTLLQVGGFTLLVLLIHLSVTGHWRTVDGITSDIAVVFWVLTATVVVGLVAFPVQPGRLSGLYNNPNGLAMTCALAGALGIGLFLYKKNPLYLPAIAMLAGTLLLTQSRTSIIAGLAAIAFVLIRRGTSTILSTLLGGATVTAFIVSLAPSAGWTFPAPVSGVVERFTDYGEAGPLSNRIAIWDYAYQLWQSQPITGYGFRSGEVIFAQARTGETVDNTVAHNSYIQMLVELGVIGLIPSFVLIVASLTILRRSVVSGLGVGLSACVVIGLCIGVGESAVFGVGQSASWTLWLAVGAAACMTPEFDNKTLAYKGVRKFRSETNSPAQTSARSEAGTPLSTGV